jgi:hypothetical protein
MRVESLTSRRPSRTNEYPIESLSARRLSRTGVILRNEATIGITSSASAPGLPDVKHPEHALISNHVMEEMAMDDSPIPNTVNKIASFRGAGVLVATCCAQLLDNIYMVRFRCSRIPNRRCNCHRSDLGQHSVASHWCRTAH